MYDNFRNLPYNLMITNFKEKIHKHINKKLGQYSAILKFWTSLINNQYQKNKEITTTIKLTRSKKCIKKKRLKAMSNIHSCCVLISRQCSTGLEKNLNCYLIMFQKITESWVKLRFLWQMQNFLHAHWTTFIINPSTNTRKKSREDLEISRNLFQSSVVISRE